MVDLGLATRTHWTRVCGATSLSPVGGRGCPRWTFTIIGLVLLAMGPIKVPGQFIHRAISARKWCWPSCSSSPGRRDMADVVVSDMAPNSWGMGLSGIASVDAAGVEQQQSSLPSISVSTILKPPGRFGATSQRCFMARPTNTPVVQAFKAGFLQVKVIKAQGEGIGRRKAFLVGVGLRR